MNNNLQQLRATGQSLWLDNITRALLDDGTLARYIRDYGITGLTSNPTIFEHAISGSDRYDAAIAEKTSAGLAHEAIFMELALEDLRRAAKLFQPAYQQSGGMDGWVSMEVSPLLAGDTAGSIAAAARIHRQADCENLYIKIPGTREGVSAIEESIYRGIPINVTLLFSSEQYLAAAQAYLSGIERRIAEGLSPLVSSVASLFVSRWDKAIADSAPEHLHNTLGLAVSRQAYQAYRDLLASDRWRNLAAAGAQPQRLLWASTSTKDPSLSDTLYVGALAAPDTVDTIPEKTLLAYADHGRVESVLELDNVKDALQPFAEAGIDVDAIASQLQREGAESFVQSWQQLLRSIDEKSKKLS